MRQPAWKATLEPGQEIDQSKQQDLDKETFSVHLYHLKGEGDDFGKITLELKNLHQNPENYWYAMGSRLLQIQELRLYRKGDYKSFSDYCSRGLGYSRQHTYKLMQMVRYIDEVSTRAHDEEGQAMARRLFSLGFTKLYVLHTLSEEELKRMFANGLKVGRGWMEQHVSLEAVTVSQLKRLIEEKSEPEKISEEGVGPGPGSAISQQLVRIIGLQARTLLRLIEECRAARQEGEGIEERLRTLEHYAASFSHGLGALDGHRDQDGDFKPAVRALVAGVDDELYLLLEAALALTGIKATRAHEENGTEKDFQLVIRANPRTY